MNNKKMIFSHRNFRCSHKSFIFEVSDDKFLSVLQPITHSLVFHVSDSSRVLSAFRSQRKWVVFLPHFRGYHSGQQIQASFTHKINTTYNYGDTYDELLFIHQSRNIYFFVFSFLIEEKLVFLDVTYRSYSSFFIQTMRIFLSIYVYVYTTRKSR